MDSLKNTGALSYELDLSPLSPPSPSSYPVHSSIKRSGNNKKQQPCDHAELSEKTVRVAANAPFRVAHPDSSLAIQRLVRYQYADRVGLLKAT